MALIDGGIRPRRFKTRGADFSHKQRVRRDKSIRRWLGLVALATCLFGGIGGWLTVSRTLPLFHTPAPVYARGFLAVGVAGTTDQSAAPVSIEEDIDTSAAITNVVYMIRFPKSAEGKRWALLMTGDAVLSHTFGFFTTSGKNLPIEHFPCSEQFDECELIQGLLPADLAGASDAEESPCDASLATPMSGAVLQVVGTSHLVQKRSSGRKSVLIPADPPSGLSLRDTLFAYTGNAIDPTLQKADATICKRVEFGPGMEVTTATPSPQYVSEQEIAWLTLSKQGAAQISSQEALTLGPTNIPSRQNIGIIGAGVAFALVCGFLPVVVDVVVRGLHSRRRKAPAD